jgi:hypothetical protein
VICLLMVAVTKAQNVGINSTGASPNPTAMLDIAATNKGVLITRVSLTSIVDVTTVPNPAVSLLVYNTNTGMTGGGVGFYYWNGMAWTKLNDGMATSGSALWNANGSNISNGNVGNVGIGTSIPITPLHVQGQKPITIPNGEASTAHVTTMINDTSAASGTESKIGLYSSVKNHSTTNVGVLTECISSNNANNYGIISSVSTDPGVTGSGCAIAAVDLIKSPDLRTFALKIDGKAQYAGVANELVKGTTLTNAGNGLMQWSKPAMFQFFDLVNDTITAYHSKIIRFSNQASHNTTGIYNSNTGELTITEAGFYHLTVHYDYDILGPSTTNGFTICYIVVNNSEIKGGTFTQRFIAHVNGAYNVFGNILYIYTVNTFGDDLTMSYSTNVYLNVGDKVKIRHRNDTDGSQNVGLLYQSSFSGYLVR